ncbi:DEKNAAC101890 [Brettanomyces naardenensis]|uniref:DEKNAAC101890 n=1 Tax=Brettanomyces naardenensis TaxID=13370 RepID=A0A448YJD9_BRENA|nr:DEKNAAC101890 [Brettanomyces naardenensis]
MSKTPAFITEMDSKPLVDGYPSNAPPYEGTIDMATLENAYYEAESSGALCESLVVRLLSSTEMIEFASSFYDIACRHEVVKGCLDSFMTLKSIIMWIYVLQTLEEQGKLCPGDSDIIAKAKERVIGRFDVGRLDERLNKEVEFDEMFDNMFGGDWLQSYLRNYERGDQAS